MKLPEKYQDLDHTNGPARFPHIRFWMQDKYEKAKKKEDNSVLIGGKGQLQRGGARMKEGENVACQYMEQEDGTVVTGCAGCAGSRQI